MSTPGPSETRPEDNDPARTFRIGHKERDEAIEILREAAGDGRITVDELGERIEKAQAAKYPVDLDEILADLVIDLPSNRYRRGGSGSGLARSGPVPPAPAIRPGSPRSPRSPRGGHHGLAGWEPTDPLVIRASWESTNQRARWQVPPYIRLEPAASNIELNFLEVDTDLTDIDVEIIAGMGSVVIVVPEDWGVNVEDLSKSWGSVKSVVNAVAEDRRPTLYVYGSIGMGSFRARFANYFDRRRMAH